MNLTDGEVIEQVEQIDKGWWSGVDANGTKIVLFPANYVEVVNQLEAGAEPAPPPPPLPPSRLPSPAPPAPPRPTTPEQATADEGVCAIAVYDNDAAEDNKMSFREVTGSPRLRRCLIEVVDHDTDETLLSLQDNPKDENVRRLKPSALFSSFVLRNADDPVDEGKDDFLLLSLDIFYEYSGASC
ncbi:hypothetical protein BD410DRAFT_531360 [Rickenella mellea]|uniref:SH3 domain-containing protein n=1 Tax=Rickenella mellea TaxID=50990 RepID=A0A4Y7QIM2_9AGAM|nr:hypothetical protein BD410DRAFT_531360 [Rickenella mellea]